MRGTRIHTLAAASMAVSLASVGMTATIAVNNMKAEDFAPVVRRYSAPRSVRRYGYAYGSIAEGNRWGGPHLHNRERARAARRAAK